MQCIFYLHKCHQINSFGIQCLAKIIDRVDNRIIVRHQFKQPFMYNS